LFVNKKMKNIFYFLRETGKLKEMPRRGWVINQIKNPESIAEHIFRATVMAWILGEKRGNLNTENLLKASLAHDLCEVYAGDTTPYDTVLPKEKKELKALMMTWPRFTKEEKEKNSLTKHEKEKKGLEDLIINLFPDLKSEIFQLWMDYEKRINLEGRFFSQADRMENFLQAYEYWEEYKTPPLEPWWLWAREFFDEPLLVEFMDLLEIRFHKRKIPVELKDNYSLLDFFNKLGKLKGKPKKEWLFYEIEDAETVAERAYHLALLVWILKRKDGDFNLERAVKISLIRNLDEVHCTKEKEEEKEEEVKKITKDLKEDLRKEIIELWEEGIKKESREAQFIDEADKIIELLQMIEYSKRGESSLKCEEKIGETKGAIKNETLLDLTKEIEEEFKEVKC
jgi:putative hydrolases of HD superfamily